ncbi:MAG: FecR domain-containing protein [Polyangiaceae bacterium]
MTDDEEDYLFEKRGAPPQDVARLEALLSPLKHDAPMPALPPRRRRPWLIGGGVMVLAAAAVVLFFVLRAPVNLQPIARSTAVVTAATSASGERWVDRTATSVGPSLPPQIAPSSSSGFAWRALDGEAVQDGRRLTAATLGPGGVLETDGTRAELDIADLGRVELAPSSRVRLLETSENAHRLALDRGKLHATIDAPPRLFFVETKAATAVDLGCEYELSVDETGRGLLTVKLGFVELEGPHRHALVPKGAECPIDPTRGPGTPVWSRSPASVRAALARFDESGDAAALDTALAGLGERDTLVLFHLLERVEDSARPRVLDALEKAAPRPAGASRKATLALEKKALDAWRADLEVRWFPGWKPKRR